SVSDGTEFEATAPNDRNNSSKITVRPMRLEEENSANNSQLHVPPTIPSRERKAARAAISGSSLVTAETRHYLDITIPGAERCLAFAAHNCPISPPPSAFRQSRFQCPPVRRVLRSRCRPAAVQG